MDRVRSRWRLVAGPGARPRDPQARWHEVERAAGGKVAVVTSVDEALAALQAAGARLRRTA